MTRRPDGYTGAGEPIAGDVSDPDSLVEPLTDVDTAYYLVHSLDSDDFEQLRRRRRPDLRRAGRGGRGEADHLHGWPGAEDERLSPHLRSRRQVEELLGAAGVPVTVLRAAVVVGHGGISWEITRQLVDHLPIMIAPAWVNTRTQPIALSDVIRYLVGVLDDPHPGSVVYEIGGPEVLRYIDMLRRAAKVMGKRTLPVLHVPLLTPRLSSGWLALVTDVDIKTARNLVDSMTTEVIVHDRCDRAGGAGQAAGL